MTRVFKAETALLAALFCLVHITSLEPAAITQSPLISQVSLPWIYGSENLQGSTARLLHCLKRINARGPNTSRPATEVKPFWFLSSVGALYLRPVTVRTIVLRAYDISTSACCSVAIRMFDSGASSREPSTNRSHPRKDSRRKQPQSPQERIDEFWSNYKTKTPGKGTYRRD